LTPAARVPKITFMTRKAAPLAAVFAFSVFALSCSEAPVVPVQPTNRRVLAELVGETG